METITQEFEFADIILNDALLSSPAVEKFLNTIKEKFGDDVIHDIEQYEKDPNNPEDGDYVAFSLYKECQPYCECEVELDPGYPAKTWGLPENCYPGSSATVYGYDDTYDMLTDLLDCSEVDMEVIDEDYMDNKKLLEWYLNQDFGPDPDEEYERHRDEGY